MASITGSGGADTLNGTKTVDTITGLAATMSSMAWRPTTPSTVAAASIPCSGGVGNDSYVVDGTGDLVIETIDAGADEVHFDHRLHAARQRR